MENVPSTAIIAVVAIVLACILAAWGFSVITSQRAQGNKAVSNVEQMNASLDESKFTVYEGATVTGSQVIAAITTLKEYPIAVTINNGTGTTTSYIYTGGPNFGAESFDIASGTKMTASEFSKALIAAQDATKTSTYITPSAQFVGAVVRNKETNAITAVTFEPVNASGSTGE